MKVINLGNRIVNNYLYPIKDGYVLIDTGYQKGYQAFLKALSRNHLSIHEISYLFLTHAHDDHVGFINDLLRDNPKTKVILSKEALQGLLRGQHSFEGGCTSDLAVFTCKIMELLGIGEHRFPPIKEKFLTRCLVICEENKSKLESLLGGRIYETPGHSKDSISLLLKNGSMFVGDAAMNGLPSIHKITIWVENKNQFYKSWLIILNLKPRKIYPGHGKSFLPLALFKNLTYVKKMKLR
jgi:glyoxylase-like metal-dependent hydrolase (beta-lactamase superfamily II)